MCALGKASNCKGKLKHPVLNSKVNHIKVKICQGREDIFGFRFAKGDVSRTTALEVVIQWSHLD